MNHCLFHIKSTGPLLVRHWISLPLLRCLSLLLFAFCLLMADLSADDAQKIGDELREKLNNAANRVGFNGLPLQRYTLH
jgi:hypothetical protein